MLDRPPRETEFLSWTYVFVCTGFIFLTIPFAADVAGYVGRTFGGLVITTTFAILAAAALTWVLLVLIKRGKTSSVGYMWFAATACTLMFLIAWRASPFPAESFHYIEYGFLGMLLYRALSHRIRNYSIYALAIIIGTLIGFCDEAIQWLTPGRYFQLADVWLNFTGVALAQVMLAAAVRPTIISGWPDAARLRRVLHLKQRPS